MRKILYEYNCRSRLIEDLTVINLTLDVFDMKYGAYMDKNAKKHIEVLRASAKDLEQALEEI